MIDNLRVESRVSIIRERESRERERKEREGGGRKKKKKVFECTNRDIDSIRQATVFVMLGSERKQHPVKSQQLTG